MLHILFIRGLSSLWTSPLHCDPPLYTTASSPQQAYFQKLPKLYSNPLDPGPCWGRTAGQTQILRQRPAPNSSRFGRAPANTTTPTLRSFARPLAVGELAISSTLVWWQLTSCTVPPPPLWERLVTWPLMRRPHMYQAGCGHAVSEPFER